MTIGDSCGRFWHCIVLGCLVPVLVPVPCALYLCQPKIFCVAHKLSQMLPLMDDNWRLLRLQPPTHAIPSFLYLFQPNLCFFAFAFIAVPQNWVKILFPFFMRFYLGGQKFSWTMCGACISLTCLPWQDFLPAIKRSNHSIFSHSLRSQWLGTRFTW